MPKNRMPRGLVALGSTAVAAIYLAGYARTQSADASIDAIVASVASETPIAATSTATPTATTAPRATATTTVAAQAAYKDGTYSGMGTSRRGNVWVSLTVASGKIELVSITRSTLQYPVRDIAGLPGQVVQRQSAQVDIVSGATYSSQAFRQAVSQALGAAQA